jgi:hypothetical protein
MYKHIAIQFSPVIRNQYVQEAHTKRASEPRSGGGCNPYNPHWTQSNSYMSQSETHMSHWKQKTHSGVIQHYWVVELLITYIFRN